MDWVTRVHFLSGQIILPQATHSECLWGLLLLLCNWYRSKAARTWDLSHTSVWISMHGCISPFPISPNDMVVLINQAQTQLYHCCMCALKWLFYQFRHQKGRHSPAQKLTCSSPLRKSWYWILIWRCVLLTLVFVKQWPVAVRNLTLIIVCT